MKEAGVVIYDIRALNPFTYAVESIRFALSLKFNGTALSVAVASLLVFFVLAVVGYDPKKGMIRCRAPF